MKSLYSTIVFLLLLQTLIAGRFTSGETRISLNGFWQFRTDPQQNGEAQQWFSAAYDDKTWNKTEVPGSWENENETANYIGKAWYRTTFNEPEKNGKRVYLEFEAVSMSYRVFLNNKLIAKELVGNYCEKFDITDLLEVKNTLAVEVDNALCWGAYINWGGIRRPVTLSLVESVHIVRQEVVATPDLKTGTSKVSVRVFIKNDSEKEQTVACQPAILFDGKKIMASKVNQLKVASGKEISTLFTFNLSKKQTNLWHFDRPNLYISEVSLSADKKILSTLSDRFGIRKLTTSGRKMLLNGEVVRMTGYNWVADDRLTANTLPVWRYKQDIDQMKELGCTFTRLSHRPLPEEVMDYLDEKGIMVISEFNNWSPFMNATSQEPRDFARKMIEQQFNHPSVVGWCVGNEMGDKSTQPQVNEYVESIIKYIKQNLDTTRLVAYVSNTADYQADDAAKYGDMIWINKYWNHEKGLDNLAKAYPDKAIFMTEYGAYGIDAGNLIYDTPNNTKYKNFIVDGFSSKEYLSGYSVWTYNDYRSRYQSPNPSTATPVHQNRQWGVVDDYRNKKRCYEQMKDYYAPVRALQVVNSENGTKITSSISITPRGIIDIPAFNLSGYKLIWEVKANDGTTNQGSFINLPVIKPGDNMLNYTTSWTKNENVAYLKVSLLSPTGYNVKDTTLYIAKPTAPQVLSVIQACRSVRVVFEKNEFCSEYALKYTVKGETKTTPRTIDHYIDLKSLPVGVPVQISVVGINGAGEGEPSTPVTIVPENGFKSLPPVIWGIVPTADGCNIGIGWVFSDTYYKVRYTTNPSVASSWKTLPAITFGAFKVNGLEAGKKYYVQVQNATQFGANPSEWSETLEVTPGLSALGGEAKLNGLLKSGKETMLSISPAEHASSYTVSYELGDKKMEETINRSELDYYVLKNAEVKNVTIKAN
jgi:beta-galactosidase